VSSTSCVPNGPDPKSKDAIALTDLRRYDGGIEEGPSEVWPMLDFELSSHAKDMMIERRIPEEWVWRTINTPRKKKMDADGNLHYAKSIREKGVST
jgi:hypothetical protein